MITAEDIITFKHSKMIHVDVSTSVYDALKTMVSHKIGAVVVTKDDTIVGLWTERDLMRLCLQDDFSLKEARIGDCISRDIHTVRHDTALNALQENFLKLFVRHVFVEKDGKIIGMISSGDTMEAGLHYKTREMEKLNSFVSIDYYENWSKPRKKR